MRSSEPIQSLLQEIARDNREAYNSLFYQWSPKLLRYASYFVHSSEVAEELVSDVFIKVWQMREKLPGIENFGGYLYTICKNKCLEQLRQSKQQRAPVSVCEDVWISHLTPADAMTQKELHQHIRQVIEGLPPRCRLIFQLAKEEGVRYKEIARLLDISVNTVDNQLAIAMEKIIRHLGPYFDYLPTRKKNSRLD